MAAPVRPDAYPGGQGRIADALPFAAHPGVDAAGARFSTAAHLVKGYAAMMGLQGAPAVAEALIRDVTEALADYAGPDGLIYPIEAVLATARK